MEDAAKVNEAAARAGRGQAIAPTMDALGISLRGIVGAMACPRPGALQKSYAHPALGNGEALLG